MDIFNLTGEVAVVIGATGELGGHAAEALAQAGASIAIIGRNAERGQARVQSILHQGGKAAFFSADASQKQSLQSVQKAIIQELGEPSILVNAAGGNSPAATTSPEHGFEQIEQDDWQKLIDTNLMAGIILPCQVFGTAMCRQGKGSIINFASVSAHIPLSKVVAYSAAKAAVLNLTRFLAREWAPHGVRVNSVTPGFVHAQQNRSLLFNNDGSPTERTRSIWNHTPMKRFGKPEELAGAILLLASPRAGSFITGSDIRVDGGFLSQTI